MPCRNQVLLGLAVLAPTWALAHPAIDAFAAHCTTKGMTLAQAQDRMAPDAGGFDLVFFDKSLSPAPDTPDHVERRCEVTFDGDHADSAVQAVMDQMATPPVFGTPIPVKPPYGPATGTALLQARELLAKRVAVVEVGTLPGPRTFIRVDRLPAGAGF